MDQSGQQNNLEMTYQLARLNDRVERIEAHLRPKNNDKEFLIGMCGMAGFSLILGYALLSDMPR